MKNENEKRKTKNEKRKRKAKNEKRKTKNKKDGGEIVCSFEYTTRSGFAKFEKREHETYPCSRTTWTNSEQKKIRKNKSEERSKNLSGSYHRDTLALTIAGCNKVVYNGFIKAET